MDFCSLICGFPVIFLSRAGGALTAGSHHVTAGPQVPSGPHVWSPCQSQALNQMLAEAFARRFSDINLILSLSYGSMYSERIHLLNLGTAPGFWSHLQQTRSRWVHDESWRLLLRLCVVVFGVTSLLTAGSDVDRDSLSSCLIRLKLCVLVEFIFSAAAASPLWEWRENSRVLECD